MSLILREIRDPVTQGWGEWKNSQCAGYPPLNYIISGC